MKVITKYNAFCHVQNNIVLYMKGKLIKTTSVFVTYAFQNPPLSSSTYLCPIKIEGKKKTFPYFSSILSGSRHVPFLELLKLDGMGWNSFLHLTITTTIPSFWQELNMGRRWCEMLLT
jgi:hypothetical protein